MPHPDPRGTCGPPHWPRCLGGRGPRTSGAHTENFRSRFQHHGNFDPELAIPSGSYRLPKAWHPSSRCTTCHDEIVVAFSCKRRGLCPSCTARRMADTAAHLVDRVLPRAPYRQWVFTVPKALRLRLARDPAWTTWVGNLAVRAIGAWQRRVARQRGLRAPRTGVGHVRVAVRRPGQPERPPPPPDPRRRVYRRRRRLPTKIITCQTNGFSSSSSSRLLVRSLPTSQW
jgi:hypothetical protein